MGKFIIGTLLILIQTMFFYQHYLQMTTQYTKQNINTIVETHAQMARFQGYFTPEIEDSLKERLGRLEKVDAENIEYSLTKEMKCTRSNQFYEGEEITYEILVPITNVNSKLFLSSNRDMVYPQRGSVTSEKKCGEV